MSDIMSTEKKTAKCDILTKFPVFSTPSSILTQPPFIFLKPNNNNCNNSPFHAISPAAVVVDVLHSFRHSVASNARNFVKFLEFSATQNPVFSKFLSFSSHIQEFSQVRLRNNRNLNSVGSHNFAAVLPGDSVAGVVVANGILNFLNLYNTVLIIRLVLTWFPSAPQQIVTPLSTLCDPYLNIFRGIIPPLGGTLDLSPILAFLVLNAFTSAASALPAELPSDLTTSLKDHHDSSHLGNLSDLTTTQKKWQRRLEAKKSKHSDSPK